MGGGKEGSKEEGRRRHQMQRCCVQQMTKLAYNQKHCLPPKLQVISCTLFPSAPSSFLSATKTFGNISF